MVIEVSEKWDGLKELQVGFAQSTQETSQETFDSLYTQSEQYYQDAINLTATKYDEQIQQAITFSQGLTGEEQERANQAIGILEQQKQDELAKYEELKNEALLILQGLKDGTIADREAGNQRLLEIANEFHQQEIESQISGQAELDALKENGYKLEQSRLAEHASEVITTAKQVAQDKITAAEEEYDAMVRIAEDVRKTDSQLADDLIADAERTKNEKIKAAQEEHVGILENLGKTYPELSRIVDLESGKQKGFWEQLFSGIFTSNKKEIDKVKEEYGSLTTSVDDNVNRMALGLDSKLVPAWKDVKTATKEYEDKVKDAKGKVEDFSKKASSSLDSPYKKTKKLKDELNALPTKKTIDITINEKTRKSTQVVGSSGPSGRSSDLSRSVFSLYDNVNALPTKKTIDITINEKTRKSTQVVGSSGPSGRSSDLSRSVFSLYDNGIAPLYDLPASLATGFTGDAGRENIGHEDNKLNKLVEELSDKLSKLIDAVGQEKVGNVYLDKRDLVGSRENIGHEDNKLNKLVEELSDKLSKLIDAVGQEKVGNVYLDKRDLVGSIKYEMSKALKLNKLVEELSDKLSKLIDAVGQEKVGNVYLDKRDLVGSIKYEMSKALVKKGV